MVLAILMCTLIAVVPVAMMGPTSWEEFLVGWLICAVALNLAGYASTLGG